jgi:hypothetical protein
VTLNPSRQSLWSWKYLFYVTHYDIHCQ